MTGGMRIENCLHLELVIVASLETELVIRLIALANKTPKFPRFQQLAQGPVKVPKPHSLSVFLRDLY
ncbi:hypothetical protein Ocin01_10430 [Orchesella cincta]|uniref:Uncharacterized protein n=1 Tax=Orchesella cincta TaxID=48709 RepID=A0A1D2MT11_ORCCI|nr:hypothetical protein Ocin01_10430 [Orchesella cincta]